jgi:hypothetical protein
VVAAVPVIAKVYTVLSSINDFPLTDGIKVNDVLVLFIDANLSK